MARLKELLLCVQVVLRQYVWRESSWVQVKVTVTLIGLFVSICDYFFSNRLNRGRLPFSSWDPLCAADDNVCCLPLVWGDARQWKGKGRSWPVRQKWSRGTQGPTDRGYMWWMLFYYIVHTCCHTQLYRTATLCFDLFSCGCDVGSYVAPCVAHDQCPNSPMISIEVPFPRSVAWSVWNLALFFLLVHLSDHRAGFPFACTMGSRRTACTVVLKV